MAPRSRDPDFATYARAFGAYGELVETSEQFAPALQRALFGGPFRSHRAARRGGGDHAVDDVVGHPRRSTEADATATTRVTSLASPLQTSTHRKDRAMRSNVKASEHPLLHYLRSGLRPARTSSEKNCGCSHAAK